MGHFQPEPVFRVGAHTVGDSYPTYFIADIGANHDGDLERAIQLIALAAESGADAAKFQNFTADTIVSDRGFRSLGGQQSHQASWKKTPYEVYADASLDLSWTPTIAEACRQAGIDYLTSPYSIELVDAVDPYVPAFKVGSGDITWPAVIEHMASKQKPLIIATGAASLEEVADVVELVIARTRDLALLQCNTNYTGDSANFAYVNLNVLKTFRAAFPGVVLGLSDHTPGHSAALGAVALGARIVEKHFTDDARREGPDHGFAMTPDAWREMVDRTRELELALGDGVKRVEDNERETVVLQRRALRTTREITAGERLSATDVTPLRPCPEGSLDPRDLQRALGRVATRDIPAGEALTWSDFE